MDNGTQSLTIYQSSANENSNRQSGHNGHDYHRHPHIDSEQQEFVPLKKQPAVLSRLGRYSLAICRLKHVDLV